MTGVTVASLASLAAVAALAKQKNPNLASRDVAELLGLWKPGTTLAQLARLAILPLASTASLFAGPIYALGRDGRLPGMRNWSLKYDLLGSLQRLTGVRNYIVVCSLHLRTSLKSFSTFHVF